jgi:hypothetical protein
MRFASTCFCIALVSAGLAPAGFAAAADKPATETIVLLRHGEKPDDGLGQLSCQGLNRALALPKVVESLFGKPDALFAPDPAHAKPDHIRSYDYVRPLATIEPTAIRFGLPIDTQFGWADDKGVVAALEKSEHRDALVLVAWEHIKLVEIARGLLADNGGDRNKVPDWSRDDFDGIFVIRIVRAPDGTHATFERMQQHLDGQSTKCPGDDRPGP